MRARCAYTKGYKDFRNVRERAVLLSHVCRINWASFVSEVSW